MSQPPTVACKNGSCAGTCTRRTHFFARLAPTCMPIRCSVTKFPYIGAQSEVYQECVVGWGSKHHRGEKEIDFVMRGAWIKMPSLLPCPSFLQRLLSSTSSAGDYFPSQLSSPEKKRICHASLPCLKARFNASFLLLSLRILFEKKRKRKRYSKDNFFCRQQLFSSLSLPFSLRPSTLLLFFSFLLHSKKKKFGKSCHRQPSFF